MIWAVLFLSFSPSAFCQKFQWQVIEKAALADLIPGVTNAQINSIANAQGPAAVDALCTTIASGVSKTTYPSFNVINGTKDCSNYFKHRFSLQKYSDYLFLHLTDNDFLTRLKSAELKSNFWNIDHSKNNQFNETYCAYLNNAAKNVFGTNRAKFFEHNVNISADYKAYSVNDYYNVFFYRKVGQTNYPIADAADNCLYNFGYMWGFGVYASQYAG